MNSDLPKITLVDDDQNILTSVSIALEGVGYDVSEFSRGDLALDDMRKHVPDLAILDIKMPVITGTELLNQMRADEKLQHVPIIFLTSKDEEESQIEGLSLGADDYITKPFSQKVLLARIDAVLRRSGLLMENSRKPDTQRDSNPIELGDLLLDEARYFCKWKNTVIDLTTTECSLLKILASSPNVVLDRERLIESAYHDESDIDDRTVDSHVKRIRQKFKKVDPRFNHIKTVYGVGYRYQI